MPTCKQCLESKPLEEFSDAQLLSGKNKCLRCSNPRLYSKKCAEGLEHLSDLGRSRKRLPRKMTEDVVSLHECSACLMRLPRQQFSSRQLSSQGHGRCKECAAQASTRNIAQQAKKRQRDFDVDFGAGRGDSEDEHYEESLLREVVEARVAAATRLSTAAASPSMPIDASNAGHRMLRQQGWKPGHGLGAQSQGDVDPLPLSVVRHGRPGLGQPAINGCDDGSAELADVDTDVMQATPGSAQPADWLQWLPLSTST